MSHSRPFPFGPWCRLTFAALALLLCGHTSLLPGADSPGPLSVAQLNDTVKEWVAEKNPPRRLLRVEGRISSFNKQVLQLRHCDVMFVGDPVGRVQKAGPVEMTGHLQRDPASRKIEFVVESLRPQPTDLERIETQTRQWKEQPAPPKGKGQPADRWNELADWAEARGQFYKDNELLAKAKDLRYHALELEAQEVPADDSRALLEMADRATQKDAPRAFVQGLNHRGCVLEYRRLKKTATAAELDAFLELARQRLPDCDKPLPSWDTTLREKYLQNPDTVHESASATKRTTLYRLLYADVLLRSLLLRLKPDSSNVLEVATQIERLVPEEAEQARQLREDLLARRAQNVARLTRTELVALEMEYRNRKQPAHAAKLVEDWLAHKREKLDPGDVDGAIDLANDYKTLLGKSEPGIQLLLETWNRVPGSPLLVERLEGAGLRLADGKWLTNQQFLNRPEGRFARAIRAGRVEDGMSAEEARRALGAPTSVARVVTSGVVTELWRYAPGDGTQRTVRLERLPGQKDFVVRGVPPLPPEGSSSP